MEEKFKYNTIEEAIVLLKPVKWFLLLMMKTAKTKAI